MAWSLTRARGRLPNWLNVVANKQDYLAQLQTAVQHLHGCAAVWRETVPVHEVFQGKTAWQGTVEVFDLIGHSKAKRAYAWQYQDKKEIKTVAVASGKRPPDYWVRFAKPAT